MIRNGLAVALLQVVFWSGVVFWSKAEAGILSCRSAEGGLVLTDAPRCPDGRAPIHQSEDLRGGDRPASDAAEQQRQALEIYGGIPRSRGAAARGAGTPYRSERNAGARNECKALNAEEARINTRMRAGYTVAQGERYRDRLRQIDTEQCRLDCVYCWQLP